MWYEANLAKQGDPTSTNKELSVVAHACHPSYQGSIK
jgi:hypothetical protein